MDPMNSSISPEDEEAHEQKKGDESVAQHIASSPAPLDTTTTAVVVSHNSGLSRDF